MAHFHAKTIVDKIFAVGIFIKAFDGLIEVVGGASLLFLTPSRLKEWAWLIFVPELKEDPHDFVATHVLHRAATFDNSAVLLRRPICSRTASRNSWS